jgi:hypothetical protein
MSRLLFLLWLRVLYDWKDKNVQGAGPAATRVNQDRRTLIHGDDL